MSVMLTKLLSTDVLRIYYLKKINLNKIFKKKNNLYIKIFYYCFDKYTKYIYKYAKIATYYSWNN